MTQSDWKDIAGTFPSTISIVAALIAGCCLIAGFVLVYRRYGGKGRFGVKEAGNAQIETAADIAFIGQQGRFWIVELTAILNNKGPTQHKIHEFWFQLDAIDAGDPIDVSKKWGGQVNFGTEVAKASFIPRGYSYCVIGPSVSARYSYVARVPESASFLALRCWLNYGRGFSNWVDKTVQVPKTAARLDKRYDRMPFASGALQPDPSGSDAARTLAG